MTETKEALRVGIIGAGIAGLAAARILRDAKCRVSLFDKGRKPGGRMSTRRHGPFSFDHGAQYFTARDPEFMSFVESCVADGCVQEWQGRLAVFENETCHDLETQERRFVGAPKMNALAASMSKDLSISCLTQIVAIRYEGKEWRLLDEFGSTWGPFEALIITTPGPQAKALIGELSLVTRSLDELAMEPCWAVLCGFESALDTQFDGVFCNDSKLSWICRNNSKPKRPPEESWVLHGSQEWSRAHQDMPADQVVEELAQEFQRVLALKLPKRVESHAHFWRYSQPKEERMLKLADPDKNLFLAGDACMGGRVEGAWLSGTAAAKMILDRVSGA